MTYAGDVKKITATTMLIFCDGDMYKRERVVGSYKLFGGDLRDSGWTRETMSKSRLAIISDATHYDILFSPRLMDITLAFLDGVGSSRSWQEIVGDAKE